jgi:ribonuclease D
VRQRPEAALLDTKVLLLWLVALTNPAILDDFKRVQNFDRADIAHVRKLLATFSQIRTTPHVLAEASNFVDQSPPRWRSMLTETLKAFIRAVPETHEAALKLIDRPEFNSFGLTDTALSKMSVDAVVITVDFRLSGKIEAAGGNTINFNYRRFEDEFR